MGALLGALRPAVLDTTTLIPEIVLLSQSIFGTFVRYEHSIAKV